ncbi:hypothetical protein LAZ67_5002671 [Cordylochernes scorpioides]|uniref:Transposase n=1 Tax=Cordylochernes scorpioides TaxID=51811 RepID=A0ABY6KHR1_9ARAC|nr:hypothetical protein LAZ67_5002671 [Cordylochernes scorpioides]
MDLPSVKLLGILWDPSLNSFTIRVKPPDIQVYSKRSLLSLIARIYDPLGWMAPLVIIFKIMLQKLWAKGCNWDERLLECIQWQWTGIEEDINQLNKISIPRYIPCRNSILTLELHGFCDSSEKAYAAVIYLKSCKHDGSVNISLIASKTKVAPIKVLSLPRLELCSALLLANLFVAVKESLSLHFDQIFLWSDSTIALNWIKSEYKRWKTFVANRVSDIQRKTPSHSWFHVPGSENPADLATRGQTPAQLIDNQLWWQGPHWLQDPSVESYVDLHPSDELSPETLIEDKSTILLYHSIVGPMPELLLKYSSWIKTVDVMAFCLRFISNCKSTNKSLNRFLSASEIHNATVKGFVSGKSNLRFLNPFLDFDGILRVGGRLRHSNLDYNQKHPLILPKRHHCTDLIIEHYHKQSLHSDLQSGQLVLINKTPHLLIIGLWRESSRHIKGQTDTGDFELDNEPHGKLPQKFEDAELQALLDEDSTQMQEKLAKQLQVSQGAVSLRLNILGMTQKLSRWVPHEHENKSFLHRIVTSDEKWIHFSNPTRQRSWGQPGQFPKQTPRPNRFGKKAMLCIWWDQTGVVYFELLKPSKMVNTSRYEQQMHSLREALNEKRPEWREKHSNLILQHDNAPAHNATVVKNTIKDLGWEL